MISAVALFSINFLFLRSNSLPFDIHFIILGYTIVDSNTVDKTMAKDKNEENESFCTTTTMTTIEISEYKNQQNVMKTVKWAIKTSSSSSWAK